MEIPKILVVDDDHKVLYSYEQALKAPGREIVTAASGEEALTATLKHRIVLILMDVKMSGLDGFQTAHLIKERIQSREIPIIFISGIHKTDEFMKQGYEIGGYDYIIKPVDNQLLKNKVHIFLTLHNQKIELQEKADLLSKIAEENRQKTVELERLMKAREEEEFEATQTSQRTLKKWGKSPVSPCMSGIGPLRERVAEVFTDFQSEYESLLDNYLDALAFKNDPPRRKIIDLTERIGDQAGGPRDVIDIHLRSVAAKSVNENPKRAQAYTVEGRLLALEVMGNLVDYYRNKE